MPLTFELKLKLNYNKIKILQSNCWLKERNVFLTSSVANAASTEFS